jgi:hypothetical protein
MLPAVDFDNEAIGDRGEIGDVRSDRPLSAKLIPGQSAVA